MTVEPASTRANRISSDSLDWSYIGISSIVGHSTSARRARGDAWLIHRLPPDPMAADGQRYAASSFGSRRYEASAAFAAIVAWAHQTSSSKADFVEASRCASMSSMGLFAPIGEVDMKSAPPMLTVGAVETIRGALVIWRRC